MRRHEYCIRYTEIQKLRDRGQYLPADVKAYCDHAEDGMCGTSISAENLKKVNDKLSGKAVGKEIPLNDHGHLDFTKFTPLKRKRGRPRKSKIETCGKTYFCTVCKKE